MDNAGGELESGSLGEAGAEFLVSTKNFIEHFPFGIGHERDRPPRLHGRDDNGCPAFGDPEPRGGRIGYEAADLVHVYNRDFGNLLPVNAHDLGVAPESEIYRGPEAFHRKEREVKVVQ